MAVVLMWVSTVGGAAAQTDVSVDEDEMAYVGEVPVERGATVTIEYLDVETAAAIECGRTTSTGGTANFSEFVLIVQRDCAEGRQDPRICWGEGACAFPGFEDAGLAEFEGSAVRDLGRLEAREPEEPSDPSTGGGVPTELAHTGTHGHAIQHSWLFWVAMAALAMGVALGGAGLAMRNR